MKMKSLYLASILLTMFGCQQECSGEQENAHRPFTHAAEHPGNNLDAISSDTLPLHKLFELADAERILGEPAHLKDTSLTVRDDATEYQSAYTADAEDTKTHKTGTVYFMVEDFKETNTAGQVYTSIRKANQDNGIEILEGLGDEAYFHSDNENFMMIMARKANKVIRLKVNKLTSHTSRDDFNIVSRNIIAKL